MNDADTRPSPSTEATDNAAGDPTGLTSALVSEVVIALDRGDAAAARRIALDLHPADLADLMGLIDRGQLTVLIEVLGADLDPEALSELEEGVRDDVLQIIDPKQIAAAITELETDDAVYLLEDLDARTQREVLEAVPASDREALQVGLQYAEETAGRLMQRDLISVPAFWTVGQVIDFMRETADLPESFYELFVVDPSNRPVGTIALSGLLRSRRARMIEDIADTDLDIIPATMDQEEVAYTFEQYGLVSAPVVDEAGRLIGVIMADDVFAVIRQEVDEDSKRLSGVGDEEITHSVFKTSRLRLPWLVISMASAFLAAAVIAMFETTLDTIVALAVLMPIASALGGNAGTQSLTVAVRALATKDLTRNNAVRVIGREAMVGSVNGLVLAGLTGLVAGIWYGDAQLGLVLAVAMVFTIILATMLGILVPLTLSALKADPAVASSPFVTTITDMFGFFTFLGLASLILI